MSTDKQQSPSRIEDWTTHGRLDDVIEMLKAHECGGAAQAVRECKKFIPNVPIYGATRPPPSGRQVVSPSGDVETPRTDSIRKFLTINGMEITHPTGAVLDLARQLERELRAIQSSREEIVEIDEDGNVVAGHAAAAALRGQSSTERADAALRATRVPDGWALVPIEPTKLMIMAANLDETSGSIRGAWLDMLEASPEYVQSGPSVAQEAVTTWVCGWAGTRCLRMGCTKQHPCSGYTPSPRGEPTPACTSPTGVCLSPRACDYHGKCKNSTL